MILGNCYMEITYHFHTLVICISIILPYVFTATFFYVIKPHQFFFLNNVIVPSRFVLYFYLLYMWYDTDMELEEHTRVESHDWYHQLYRARGTHKSIEADNCTSCIARCILYCYSLYVYGI